MAANVKKKKEEPISMEERETILKELKHIRKDIEEIKAHVIDPDDIVTEEEARAIEQSLREYKEGKTIPYEKLRKKLNLG